MPIWLVVSTPLKNMKVSWDYYSQYMEKKCSKPPTSYLLPVNQSRCSPALQPQLTSGEISGFVA